VCLIGTHRFAVLVVPLTTAPTIINIPVTGASLGRRVLPTRRGLTLSLYRFLRAVASPARVVRIGIPFPPVTVTAVRYIDRWLPGALTAAVRRALHRDEAERIVVADWIVARIGVEIHPAREPDRILRQEEPDSWSVVLFVPCKRATCFDLP